MSMQRKSWIMCVGLLVVCVSLLVFVGCLSAQEEKPFEGVTLYVSALDWLPVHARQEITPEFEQKTGIKVVYDILPYEHLREKQMIEFMAGTGAYDIIHWDVPWLAEYYPYLEPLTEKFIKPMDYPELVGQVIPAVRKGFESKGALYGFPLVADCLALYYRKDLFEDPVEKGKFKQKYGYELDVPETWQEFTDVAQFFTRDTTGDGKIDFWGTTIQGARTDPIWCEWITIFWSWGGEVFDENWKPTINSKAGIESLKWYSNLFLRHKAAPPGAPTYTFDSTTTAVQQGLVAMSIQWMFAAPMFEDPKESKVVGKIGYAEVPRRIRHAPYLGGFAEGIAKDSKHPDAAFEYLKWLNQSEQQYRIARQGVNVPRAAVLSAPELRKMFPLFEYVDTLVAHAKFPPQIPEYSEMVDVIGTAASEALTGEASPEEALDKANSRLQRVMEKAGYYR